MELIFFQQLTFFRVPGGICDCWFGHGHFAVIGAINLFHCWQASLMWEFSCHGWSMDLHCWKLAETCLIEYVSNQRSSQQPLSEGHTCQRRRANWRIWVLLFFGFLMFLAFPVAARWPGKTLPERVCLHRGLATSFSKLGGQLRGFTILVLTRILGKKNYMIC